MSVSPDDEPPDHGESSRLLSWGGLIAKATQDVNGEQAGIEEQGIELGHIYSPSTDRDGQARGQDSAIDYGREHFSVPKVSLPRGLRACYRWIQGRQPSRPFKITTIFPQIQHLPVNLLDKWFGGKQKVWLLLAFCLCWVASFTAILAISERSCRIPGYKSPLRLSCVSRLWRGSTKCGVNGINCRPFHNFSFAFRCPVDCRDTRIFAAETVGDTEYNYQSIIVGGAAATPDSRPIYRGDSFVCGAAIHAGIISNYGGGSGVVKLIGEHNHFGSVEAHGISSLNFTPSFPLAFTFLNDENEIAPRCKDPRWILLAITLIFTATISLCTTSPFVFFGTTFVSVYFCVSLASDPHDDDNETYPDVVSLAFRSFLPAAFVGLVLYRYCVHRTLTGLTAQLEKTVLWLGGCWLGALNNFTFDKLPIQRLTPHDLRQPGAILTLISIICLIIAITIGQAWALRVEGRLPRYLAFYACIGLLFLALIAVPNMNVRIHHFILALILLPGTALQTRPSLLYQGLLVGLFISGIARWGFDSILQTSIDLFGDDFGTLIPQVDMPTINTSNNSITFSVANISQGYDSMSVVINDVERFRGSEDHDGDTFTWQRYKEDEPEYFRFAFVKYGITKKATVGTFTNPGVWQVDGTWIPPEPKEVE